jgi:hypothetical protein
MAKNPLKPKPGDHWIKSQHAEIFLGFILVIVGCVLLWDGFDNRGRKMPWPLGGLAPW